MLRSVVCDGNCKECLLVNSEGVCLAFVNNIKREKEPVKMIEFKDTAPFKINACYANCPFYYVFDADQGRCKADSNIRINKRGCVSIPENCPLKDYNGDK